MTPSVRLWKARVDFRPDYPSIGVYHVLAPTRLLARLNLRHERPETMGRAILTLGILKKPHRDPRYPLTVHRATTERTQ